MVSAGGSVVAEDGGIQIYYPLCVLFSITFESIWVNISPTYSYQDVHVMVFVGFGFLVTFMHGYSITAVSLNFVLAAMAIQWSSLTTHFFFQIADPHRWHSIIFEIKGLIDADFAAAALLITFGCLFGKVSPVRIFTVESSRLPVFKWLISIVSDATFWRHVPRNDFLLA